MRWSRVCPGCIGQGTGSQSSAGSAETDEPEDINSICYLKEVDIDTLEVTGEIKDFVAIVSDKYHEIASEFP